MPSSSSVTEPWKPNIIISIAKSARGEHGEVAERRDHDVADAAAHLRGDRAEPVVEAVLGDDDGPLAHQLGASGRRRRPRRRCGCRGDGTAPRRPPSRRRRAGSGAASRSNRSSCGRSIMPWSAVTSSTVSAGSAARSSARSVSTAGERLAPLLGRAPLGVAGVVEPRLVGVDDAARCGLDDLDHDVEALPGGVDAVERHAALAAQGEPGRRRTWRR